MSHNVLFCCLQDLSGKSRGDLDHLLHVRALGSYVRGKVDTGDIGRQHTDQWGYSQEMVEMS